MNQPVKLRPLFYPGRLLIAPGTLATLRAHGVPVPSIILRHIAGDWGSVSDADKRENDLSIRTGLRLISIYPLPDGARILVVTEWNRSQTTIELLEQAVPASIAPQRTAIRCSYPAWPAATCRARIAA